MPLDQSQYPHGMAEDENGRPIPKVKVSGLESNSIQPIEIQSRIATTTQVVPAQSVAPTTGTYTSSWVDCDGFSDIAVTFMNDASTNAFVDLNWSHDGSTYHSADFGVLPTGTISRRAVSVPIKARWVRVVVANTDAAPHTMNAWAYLKA